ncbi:rhodanese-like domain-containing protein [Sulfitobacter sp. HNIBRBA2951]|uniref:rhodanese-like domain-containing protein n=1 Tax=Sulfitobacter aquimarinus TaxID=3158557 RepID=UPI0032DF6C1C
MQNTKISRRSFLWRGTALGTFAVGGVTAARWFNVAGSIEGSALSVAQAHSTAIAGDITLIDIRRPDEWARTGVGQGAVPIDMRDPAFVRKLLATAPGRDAPIALICARGVRSRALAARLKGAGFTRVIDVPEGMLGSGAGPGWLAAGLPVVKS